MEPEDIIMRLEDAYLIWRAMPGATGPAQLGAQTYGYVAEVTSNKQFAAEMAKAGLRVKLRPTRDQIGEAEEVMRWLSMIRNVTVRRIVALRSMVHPVSRRAPGWRKIGAEVGASHEACRAWHATGISEIMRELRRKRIA